MCLIILVCAAISSIAGFAFSAISGSALLHVVRDPVEAVQIMLTASIAVQAYRVWALPGSIRPRELVPYFAGGAATIAPGLYLILNTPVTVYLLALSAFLAAYGTCMLLRPPLRLERNSLAGRVAVGALGGITGATTAFPSAFITIWCAAQGWDKQHQRAGVLHRRCGAAAARRHVDLTQIGSQSSGGSHESLSASRLCALPIVQHRLQQCWSCR